MDGQLGRLAALLADFDRRQGQVEYHDVSAAVDRLAADIRQNGGTPGPDIMAEAFAMSVCQCEEDRPSHWGTCYGPMVVFDGRESPAFRLVTPDSVSYWTARARATGHPYLRARYADLAWEFAPHVPGAVRTPDAARLMVDAVLAARGADVIPHTTDARWWLQRALSAALSLRDTQRADRVHDTIIDRESRVPLDAPGHWGDSFDLLVEGSRRVRLTDEQRRGIFDRLEARLSTLAANAGTVNDILPVEGAAARLARHYCHAQRPDDVRRVMTAYSEAVLRSVADSEGLVAAYWLQHLDQQLRRFNQTELAEGLQPHYRERSRQTLTGLNRVHAEVQVPTAEVDAYIAERTQGSYEEVFTRLAHEFVHRRQQMEEGLQELLQQSIVANLFGTTLLDHQGRATATIGPADRDTEGRLVHYTDQRMQTGAPFLRLIVERLVSDRNLSADDVTGYLFQSTLFAPEQHGLVAAGVRAYLAGDWVSATHLRLAEGLGSPVMGPNRNGGYDYLPLGALLGDDRVRETIGPDAAFHLSVLLTDHRGMNARNNVAHGLWPTTHFTSQVADLLFHVLILLGNLRERPVDQPAEPPSDASGNTSIAPPPTT
jgi:lysyl-tRNA synthetase class 1